MKTALQYVVNKSADEEKFIDNFLLLPLSN